MLQPRLPDALERDVKSRFSAALEDEPAALVEFGARLLTRVSPPNWALEWSLPGWLGEVLGLDESAVADLTLANVFGLAYIKLQDDLIDGETGADDRPAAVLLSSVLHRKWLLTHTKLAPGGSPFWGYFERYMAQWMAATWVSHRSSAKLLRDYEDADWRSLGHRGAPLKTCAAAACLLAEREPAFPQLEQALDHLLTGAVLFDHARDWSADLTAGRYNAFIAHAAVWPQTSAHKEINRRAVLQELLVGNGGRSYFQLLQGELLAAQSIASQSGCKDLARYIAWLRREVISYRSRLRIRARDQLHRALEPVLRTAELQASGLIG